MISAVLLAVARAAEIVCAGGLLVASETAIPANLLHGAVTPSSLPPLQQVVVARRACHSALHIFSFRWGGGRRRRSEKRHAGKRKSGVAAAVRAQRINIPRYGTAAVQRHPLPLQ